MEVLLWRRYHVLSHLTLFPNFYIQATCFFFPQISCDSLPTIALEIMKSDNQGLESQKS